MTIAEFLVTLANDPEALEAFREDPHGYLETVDLSDEQKQVLTAGKLVDIRYLVEVELEVPREPSEAPEQAADAAAASDAPTETTTVSFVRPVWLRPVWIRGTDDS